MNRKRRYFEFPPVGALLLAAMPLLLHCAEPAAADDSKAILTEQQIEQALQPAAATRSFVPRGLTRRDSADAGVSVNLKIPFAHNSSELMPQAALQLRQLGSALNSASLGQNRFVIAGHTDAKGSAPYNQQLSLRRAQAVKRYLVSHGIDTGRLETVGYGSDRLLVPDRPEDPSNRRVEVRDLGRTAH